MDSTPHTSLCEALSRFSQLDADRDHTLGELLEAIDDKGFGLLLIILALPSALPLPATGYSTPFGIMIVTLGVQMLRGRHTPWLPEKAKKTRLPRRLFRGMIDGGTKFLGWVEHLIRPRFYWITKTNGRRLLATLVLLMGALMCLPIPGTNSFPAGVVFLVGVCLSEEDGLVGVAACLAGLLALAVYAAAIFFLIQFFSEYGWEAIDVFLEKVKELVKNLGGSNM